MIDRERHREKAVEWFDFGDQYIVASINLPNGTIFVENPAVGTFNIVYAFSTPKNVYINVLKQRCDYVEVLEAINECVMNKVMPYHE